MISLDINIDDMKKHLKAEHVIKINELLLNPNNIVGQCRLVMGDVDDYYAILSMISNGIDNAYEIFFIKENITLELFQIQMLKELNRLAIKAKNKIKARIEGIN